MRRRSRINSTRAERRGILLAILLACIVIAALLTTGLLKGARQWRRQVRYESYSAQADWLAESGLHRAAAMLGRDNTYQGETWELTTADGLRHPASIIIEVKATGGNRTVHVTADYKTGIGSSTRAKRTLRLNSVSGANTND